MYHSTDKINRIKLNSTYLMCIRRGLDQTLVVSDTMSGNRTWTSMIGEDLTQNT